MPSGRLFLIADTHFGSEQVRRFENRPFENTQEMDKVMTERWNSVVSPEDTVWHLGDFGAEGCEAPILSQLNGNILFVKGNHDVFSNDYYRSVGFREVYDYPVLLREFWLLSHEPLYVSENTPYANIFGHIHQNPMYTTCGAHHAYRRSGSITVPSPLKRSSEACNRRTPKSIRRVPNSNSKRSPAPLKRRRLDNTFISSGQRDRLYKNFSGRHTSLPLLL